MLPATLGASVRVSLQMRSDPQLQEIRTKYVAYIEQMLTLGGVPEPGPKAKEIMAFETAAAKAQWPIEKRRDVEAIYNPRSKEQLLAFAPGFPWQPFLTAQELGTRQQLVLGDGKEIWFYDKDLQQANVRRMDATLASTPAVLLSGTGSVAEQFDIKALPDEGGLRWYQLLPKHPDTDFQLVRIGFDKDGELASMFLADKLNQITQLTFTHPVKNPKLIPDLFTFSPPPGVDVIGRDSK